MVFAAPDTRFPVRLADGSLHTKTVFLSAILDHPRISVGEYTYFSCHQTLQDVDIAALLAPYLYDWSPEALHIGRFCQIAHGVQFITSSANHRYDGLSSFPFAIFDDGPNLNRPSLPEVGHDTYVGHDVWLGTGTTVLPGARIGDGAIVGAQSVVAGEIAPYTIVAGNPARLLRARLSNEDAARMQAIAWWDWPIDVIMAHEADICGTDLDALAAIDV